MVEESPPASVRLVWDANARAYRPAQERGDAGPKFVKGPIPYAWLERAGRLPGKALHVALGLWWMTGLCCSRTFPFKRKAAGAFGASKDATYDALRNLEKAGLISVVRHRGRSPVVTILAI